MNKYHITTIDHDGNMQDEMRDDSFNLKVVLGLMFVFFVLLALL